MTAREWVLDIIPPDEFVTANVHGRKDRRSWSGVRARWREASCTLARRDKLPVGLERARIDVVIAPPSDKFDNENFAPTAKILVDGLGPPVFKPPSRKQPKGVSAPGYRLIPNDNPKHLDGPHLHVIDPVPPRGHVTIYIAMAGLPLPDVTGECPICNTNTKE